MMKIKNRAQKNHVFGFCVSWTKDVDESVDEILDSAFPPPLTYRQKSPSHYNLGTPSYHSLSEFDGSPRRIQNSTSHLYVPNTADNGGKKTRKED